MDTTFKVAGTSFRDKDTKDLIRGISVGDILLLEADPTNEYDGNAIKILVDTTFIGFVPRDIAAELASALTPDHFVRVIGFTNDITPVVELHEAPANRAA